MIRATLLLLCILTGCAQQTEDQPYQPLHVATASLPSEGKLLVDTERSVICWTGTKFWGLGKHSGIVRLAEGHLTVEDATIKAGSFIIDMNTVEITGIPESDAVPRNRLRNHLMDEDFFAVETYPTAQFELTEVEAVYGKHAVTGNLTLRGQTHPVTFGATFSALSSDAVQATARFSIDRQRWGVAYRGSRLTNDLVDDDIHLELLLIATSP